MFQRTPQESVETIPKFLLLRQMKVLEMETRSSLVQCFSSLAHPSSRWAINLDGIIVEILEIVIAKIRVNPTHAMGWFSLKLKNAWEMLSETPSIVWKSIPQISPIPEFCNKNPWEMLSERRMLEIQPISTSVMANQLSTKLIQVCQPTREFNLHSIAQEIEMGILQHRLTLISGKGQTGEWWRKMGWSLMEEAKLMLSFDECPTPNHALIMNIILWNSRGALKPNFQNYVREFAQNHDPAIMVITETKIGGERAKEITDRLPFDMAIHTDTIGYAKGLWLLWNSDRVEISLLAKTEQEIHVTVKVRASNFSWPFSAVYASLRFEERAILWNNLSNLAEL